MASAISFSGIASGIDSSSLIKSLLDQERQRKIKPLEVQLSDLNSTNDSFNKMKSLLESLKSKASAFRVLNGGGISKTGSSSDDGVASATASNAATAGTYSVSVTQLAKNATFSFDSTVGTYTSTSDAISPGSAFASSVTVDIGATGSPIDSVTVNIDQTTTLDDFVVQFNSQTTDAVASVVNVGTSSSPSYKLVINTAKTGLASGEIDVTVGAGLSARGAFDSNLEDDAQDAIFSIAGIATGISRSTNSISDVITGVNLDFRDTGTATLKVGIDGTKTASGLKDFVEAFNAVVSYIDENDAVVSEQNGSETINIFGTLSNTSIDDNALSALRSALSSASGSGGLINTLSDLGISTQRDGTLKFDQAIFDASLAKDPGSAEGILARLGETLAATSGTIDQFTRFNGLIGVATNSNTNTVTNLTQRISEIETSLSRYEESLVKRFSALEVLSGRLQSAQAALASMGI